MASFFDKISGKARKNKIDGILKQAEGGKKKPAPKPKKRPRDGGKSSDDIMKFMEKLKREQDAKAGNKRR